MSTLLDLPEEVVEKYIVSHLNWNGLLRCRRVCKVLKGITDDYIRLHPELAPEIEISEQSADHNLESFLTMSIPTTKLFINNPTGHIYYDNLGAQTLTEFTETYGPIIKFLRVEQLSLHPCFNEWTFLSSFQNLKTFEAAYFGLGVLKPNTDIDEAFEIAKEKLARALTDPRCTLLYNDDQCKFGSNCFPVNFQNSLETLKIGRNPDYMTVYEINARLHKIFAENLNIHYIAFPTFSTAENPFGFCSVPPNYLINLDRQVGAFRVLAMQVEKGILKWIDFQSYYEDFGNGWDGMQEIVSEVFYKFLEYACKHDVKLMNVTSTWFYRREMNRTPTSLRHNLMNPELYKPEFGIPVVSLVNLHPFCFPLDLTNLERIDIRRTSETMVNIEWFPGRRQWPKLKSLEINVDSVGEVRTGSDPTNLFKLLFRNIERPQVEELCLKFEMYLRGNGVPVPKAEDIVKSCPNLKRLRIVNWLGKQKQLISLWGGLPKLEEISLEYCKDMGNVAFVGEDVQNPVFFQLKNLKKLTLKGLDQMPKVTNTLFGMVLAHMNLTCLILTSDKPLEKVTRRGINALLDGEFSGKVEKFPFSGWSLANVSAKEFEKIGKQFRSSQML